MITGLSYMHFNSLFNEKNDFHTYICRVSEIEDFERILKGIFLKKESVHSGFCYVHFSDRVIDYCADAAFDMISVKKRAVETIALNHMFESFTMDVYRFIEEQQDNTLFAILFVCTLDGYSMMNYRVPTKRAYVYFAAVTALCLIINSYIAVRWGSETLRMAVLLSKCCR